eukprot:CAMPEP_0175848768 /NCGR_PEP_ID=MMETSP0107_2-20121207/24121_1 /TAXON_ID=195067 ORGANISM="Goniomonas pacifica, Strain CCMP1869" /NCGR_SAMPLE_ID=MMETSP0107_2 /ASSEMBLY_ACC=CAM_ASM_000203 /LENGTH=36 /DNA_ID= /DNA_START= /DNA_END= /DNA_ORIENTATION=
MPAQSDAVVRLKPYSDIQSAQGNVLLPVQAVSGKGN